jgi:hypothetical protein
VVALTDMVDARAGRHPDAKTLGAAAIVPSVKAGADVKAPLSRNGIFENGY